MFNIEQSLDNGKNNKAEAEIVSICQTYGIRGRGKYFDQAKNNVKQINEFLKTWNFNKNKHYKATYRYSFEEVSEDKTLDEELKDMDIDEKWFYMFFNEKIKKISVKSDEIMPVEQYRKIVSYFKKKKTLKKNDDKFEINTSTGNSTITKKDDVYVITNLTLYDVGGEIVRHYPAVEFDASPVLDADGKPILNSQEDWLDYYKYEETAKDLPSLPLYFAILETIFDNKQNKTANELFKILEKGLRLRNQLRPHYQYEPTGLATSSRLYHSRGKFKHDSENPDLIVIKENIDELNHSGLYKLTENLVNEKSWEVFLKGLFMAKDVKKIQKVLGMFNDKVQLKIPSSSSYSPPAPRERELPISIILHSKYGPTRSGFLVCFDNYTGSFGVKK